MIAHGSYKNVQNSHGMIRDKNNIFERVENFHADLAWNYPEVRCVSLTTEPPSQMQMFTHLSR